MKRFAIVALLTLLCAASGPGCATNRMSVADTLLLTGAATAFAGSIGMMAASRHQHPERNQDACVGIGVGLDVLSLLLVSLGMKSSARKEDE